MDCRCFLLKRKGRDAASRCDRLLQRNSGSSSAPQQPERRAVQQAAVTKAGFQESASASASGSARGTSRDVKDWHQYTRCLLVAQFRRDDSGSVHCRREITQCAGRWKERDFSGSGFSAVAGCCKPASRRCLHAAGGTSVNGRAGPSQSTRGAPWLAECNPSR